MSDEICDELDSKYGIVSATSGPTGMRNEGPEQYEIYYDDAKQSVEGVRVLLKNELGDVTSPDKTADISPQSIPSSDDDRQMIAKSPDHPHSCLQVTVNYRTRISGE